MRQVQEESNPDGAAWEVKAYGDLTDIMNAAITPSLLALEFGVKLPQGSLAAWVIDTPVTPTAQSITHPPFMGKK